MTSTLLKTKLLRPNVHYLDVISKVKANNGEVSELYFLKKSNYLTISFEYSFIGFPSCFKEEFTYNDDNELISWITTANGKQYTVFKDNEAI